MKNVNIRFTVMTNDKVYFATSLKAIVSFCKQNDFVIDNIDDVLITDQNKTEKCGWGVYCVLD